MLMKHAPQRKLMHPDLSQIGRRALKMGICCLPFPTRNSPAVVRTAGGKEYCAGGCMAHEIFPEGLVNV